LLLTLIVLLGGTAFAAPRLTVDQSGALYQSWLAPTGESLALTIRRSPDQGINFGPAQILYRCSAETTSADLAFGPNRALALVYGTTREAWFTFSADNGRTFSLPQQLTGEAATDPAVALDGAGQPHFLYLVKIADRDLTELRYVPGLSTEAVVLERSADTLGAPRLFASPWGLIALFTKTYQTRQNTFYAVSPDNGRHFSRPQLLDPAPEIAAFIYQYRNGKLDLPRPAPPEPHTPSPEAISNSATVEISYRQPATDPVVTRLDLSTDPDFPADRTWTFERLDLPATGEGVYRLPIALADAVYYWRLMTFNGVTASQSSPTRVLRLDRQAPLITLTGPAGTTSEARQITVTGLLSEKGTLTINGTATTVESGGKFSRPWTLAPGANQLRLIATDEAGNAGTLTRPVAYSTVKPLLTVLKPRPDDWFRPDSSILFSITVTDLQADVADESEAELVIAGQSVPDQLIYSRDDGSLSGFIKLPIELGDGRFNVTIRLRDEAGNLAEERLTLNIDRTAPVLVLASGEAFFCNAPALVPLPLCDTGAGLDPAGTLVNLLGTSGEVVVSGEALLLKPVRSLAPGSYEVIVTPRDRIGNTGPQTIFTLVIDDQAPTLIITGSQESGGRLRLAGEVVDQSPDRLKVYNSGKLIDNYQLCGPLFIREFPLTAGHNELRIEAVDRAGNSSSQQLSVQVAAIQRSATVARLGHAPNPFTAGSGEMYFTYVLNSSADLKFFIFDLSGTLIWQRTLTGTGSGSLAWNGIDHFGRTVARGVYPYIVQVAAGGVDELYRGKIIVY
jgi:hypothetical protein